MSMLKTQEGTSGHLSKIPYKRTQLSIMSPLSAVLLVSGYRSSLEQERGRAEKLLRLGPAGGGPVS